jgi:hypothetical protein
MFVYVNKIMKNYSLLYKVTPQVSKIFFLVYLVNYSQKHFLYFLRVIFISQQSPRSNFWVRNIHFFILNFIFANLR